MAPQVDIRVVVGVVITVVSVIQYLGWWHSYNTAITAALRMPRYKLHCPTMHILIVHMQAYKLYNLCLLWFVFVVFWKHALSNSVFRSKVIFRPIFDKTMAAL